MNKQLSKSCSDDKPITAVMVIEDVSKCPKGFTVISRTYDGDVDADLWKDNSFFTKKVTRYLCMSKDESIANYVLENLVIINEKELPPEGYGSIQKTADTEQRAWRKKQLCYKLSRRNICHAVVTDMILLNKSRKAPEGFHLLGDLNGLLLCVKMRPAATVFDNIAPGIYNGHIVENVYNGNGITNEESHDYEKLIVKPVRPAPAVPGPSQMSFSSSYHGLQGVPFLLNTRLEANSRSLLASLPDITIKTIEDIDKEYAYDFQTEKQLCLY